MIGRSADRSRRRRGAITVDHKRSMVGPVQAESTRSGGVSLPRNSQICPRDSTIRSRHARAAPSRVLQSSTQIRMVSLSGTGSHVETRDPLGRGDRFDCRPSDKGKVIVIPLSQPTRWASMALAGLIALFAILAGTSAGDARAESFKYWSLWTAEDGTWTAATVGAADLQLDDQSVFAAKYVESEVELTAADAPSEKAKYLDLCPDQQPQDGDARVAVVIDYGEAGLAPEGQTPPTNELECLYVPQPATGAAALSVTATVTEEASGFITAINGYPKAAEGETASAEPIVEDPSEGAPWGWIIGVVALVIIAILIGLAISRRNTSREDNSSDSGV